MMKNNRDDVVKKIAGVIRFWGHDGVQQKLGDSPPSITDKDIERVNELFSRIAELVIVDRDAELPQNPHMKLRATKDKNPSYQIYATAQHSMRVDGWLKELK